MYLKSIEVHGFKAFANKIVFNFQPGITGIVGPNGSGKSNVADAVRWVLGEQSAKQLRGSSMQDVIFAGTETRKPLGFAYVALTLDNSDHWLPIEYDEVTVGRRVYRSGESEYLINGAECRLRDVQELFYDTGVGKEGYSIIGQGQIDKILSGKPEERREIFDEAAGITKVKKRKASTEKNLEAERQNLARVTDVIREIETRIGPLEKQSEKAKIYLGYKDELKRMEVNQFLLEYERSASVKADLDEKICIATADFEKSKADFSEAKDEYDRLLEELERYQDSLRDAKERHADASLRKEKAAGEQNLLTEQITGLKASLSEFETRSERISAQIAEREKALLKHEEEMKEQDKVLSALMEEQTKAEALLGEMKAGIDAILAKEKACNDAHVELLRENTELKTELERYNTILEQSNIRKAELNGKLLTLKGEADAASAQVEEAEKLLKEACDRVIAGTEAVKAQEEQIRALNDAVTEQKHVYERRQERVIQKTSHMETLRDLVEHYDGYGNAVKKVMERKNEIPGIYGVMADIIRVAPEYETAVETALGGNVQNIVTDSAETAKKLIAYLKENRLGRATFIPLSDIRAKKEDFPEDVLKEKGVLGTAASLVETEETFREAVQYLLGRFLVVENIDLAIKLQKKNRYSLRLVTKEGELFQPGGAIAGGSFRSGSNLLGKRREAEELENSLVSEKKELKEAEEKLAKLREDRENLRNAYEESRKRLQEDFVAQNTAKLNLNHIMEQNGDILSKRDSLRHDIAEAEEALKANEDAVRMVTEKIRVNTEAAEQQKKQAEDLHAEMEQTRLKEDSAGAEAMRVLSEYSGLQQNIAYRKDNARRIEREKEELLTEQKDLKDRTASAGADISAREEAVERIIAEQKSLEEELAELSSFIKDRESKAEEITKQNKGFFERREALSADIARLDRELLRLDNQREKLNETLDYQKQYISDEYGLNYDEAVALRDETIDNPVLNRRAVYEMKGKIRALGDVNVNAIEDYRETKERYDFLTGQRDDIVNAEKSLTEIITTLDAEMRKQFTETFGLIQDRFDRVFKELFGGGKGTLKLQEDADVLEADISVIAQPPGKKLQNMMQLSGGEKALTAISLLFAILDLKPSPFCLLDEIEAALDDSNVSRFAKYLHKLTKDTQFIVITHRRGTMAAADALYGITMQEKGVSTLVSVNLIEHELDK